MDSWIGGPSMFKKATGLLIVLLFVSEVAISSSSYRGKVTTVFGDAIPGATVRIAQVLEEDGRAVSVGPFREVTVGQSGEFEFRGLRLGRYFLEASSAGFKTFSLATRLQGGEAHLRLILNPKNVGQESATVAVFVGQQDGKPVPNASVVLLAGTSLERQELRQTGEDGMARFEELVLGGEHVLYVSGSGFSSELKLIQFDRGENLRVSVELRKH